MIEIKPDQKFNFTLTGIDLQTIAMGLGEIPHKLARPVEMKLIEQINAQTTAKSEGSG